MIFTDSRYTDSVIYRAQRARDLKHDLVVRRIFPSETSGFFYYTWRERDRIENIAAKLLGDSNQWWKIMDYNPEIIDAINIRVGSTIRIPYDE